MGSNVRMLSTEIPAYQVAKRARLDQLERESQEGAARSLTAMGLILLMLLGTAIVVVWSIQAGWWA